MTWLGDYRNPELVRSLVARLHALPLKRKVRLMEVCGGHTAVIHRSGLPSLLPASIELISGPGCPVCVTPNNFVDQAIALAESEDVTLTTFGDLIRVPGSTMSLSQARASGADVRVVYSSADALDFAISQPNRMVVFLGIGFETTACTIAETLSRAIKHRVKNFKLLSALKTMPAALQTLLASPGTCIDGLILPGHVTAITGTKCFEFIVRDQRIGCSVSGFEPVDLLESTLELANQVLSHVPRIANRYRRAVQDSGNDVAQRYIEEVFTPCAMPWRGLGSIPESGLSLRSKFMDWDASLMVSATPVPLERAGCRCGEILRGAARPRECALFGMGCTPDTPVGACMISSEGACAAVYNYQAADVF